MNSKIKEKLYNDIKGDVPPVKVDVPERAQKLADFLTKHYGFYDVTFVARHVYNIFMLAMDAKHRMLFIKTGRHPELYRNEYIMGKQLWDMDNEHFLQPLYYADSGDNLFFANEIMANGDSLQRLADSGQLGAMPADAKMLLIRDLYKIFQDLKKSDVVHRDIRPSNLAVLGEHLILIDFQLAVSKSNYQELESMTAGRLRGLGTRKYRYKTWHWDDSYSLLQCLKLIGCPSPQYRAEYNKIYRNIKSYIGHDVIVSSKRESFVQRIWLKKYTWSIIFLSDPYYMAKRF